jgi:hypothetical protein
VRRVEDLIARKSRVKKFRLSESAHRDRPLTTAASEELKNFGSDGRVIDRRPRKKRDVIPLGILERPYVEERHPQKRTILRLLPDARHLRGMEIVRVGVDPLRIDGDPVPIEDGSRESIVRED